MTLASKPNPAQNVNQRDGTNKEVEVEVGLAGQEKTEIRSGLNEGDEVVTRVIVLGEGLDIREVSLVAILDADKEGFLRSTRSLIQTIGRAARHINGTTIMYADVVTHSMRQAIDETERRRGKQQAYNVAHGIVPRGVSKRVKDIIEGVYDAGESHQQQKAAQARKTYEAMSEKELTREVKRVEKEMLEAARRLEFERAAELRNRLAQLKRRLFTEDLP